MEPLEPLEPGERGNRVPQPAKEPLELQVATLTKQLSEAKDAATKEAHRARQKLSKAESEAKESKRALSLTLCVRNPRTHHRG